MLDLRTLPAAEAPSAKPWPTRNWDNAPGRFMDLDAIRSMKPDYLKRDDYSTEHRCESWEIVHAYHMWARENNPGLPPKTGFYLFSADQGEGKSHSMIAFALSAWMFRAVPVFSTESMGALFGYRLDLEDIYNFADTLEEFPGSIILIDELAALADVQSNRANRGRVLNAGGASFRKGGNLGLTATAAEHNIDPRLRPFMRGVIKPEKYRPTKTKILKRDYYGRPTKVAKYPLKPNELEFPEYCYLKAKVLEQPWEGRRIFEDYESALYELEQQNKAKHARRKQLDPRWKLDDVAMFSPLFMDLAASMYDTFMRVPTSDPYSIDADRMRERMESRKGSRKGITALRRFLEYAEFEGIFSNYSMKDYIEIRDLHTSMGAWNPEFAHSNIKDFRSLLTKWVGAKNISRRRVSLAALNEVRHGKY